MANFDPYRIKTPEPIEIKFGTGDYVPETTPQTKFSANPCTGGASAQIVKRHNNNFLIEVSRFSGSKYRLERRSKNLKIRPLDPDLLGYFNVIHEMRFANIYRIGLPNWKFLASYPLRIYGQILKFKKFRPGLDPDLITPFCKYFVGVFALRPFQIHGRGYLKISLGPWPRHFGGIFSSVRWHPVYQIRSFYI